MNMDRQPTNQTDQLRRITDVARAVVILGVSIVLLIGDFFHLKQVESIDPLLKYLFGGASFFYGSYRLYRGFKKDQL